MASTEARVTSLEVFFGDISDFVNSMKGKYELDTGDFMDIELTCGIALAYCIKYGLDSDRDFKKSAAKFDETQLRLSCVYVPLGQAWNLIPIWTLNSRAA